MTVAEIERRIADVGNRPRKTFITPSTRIVGHAIFYKALERKVEALGTRQFPKKNGVKMYGKVIVYIPVYQDGTIFEKEGGIRIERSSGNPDLDKAAIDIVRRSAPFDAIPPEMLSPDRDNVWVIITDLNFTRETTAAP